MKKNAGFTLMELMITIAIIGTLSAIAVPNMISWRNNMQFNSSVRMIKTAIESARMNAIKSNMPARVNFNVGGNTFNTVKWDIAANAFAAAVPNTLPPGTTISASTFAGNQLQFNSRGMSNNGSVTVLSSRGLSRRVLVDVVGTSQIVDGP